MKPRTILAAGWLAFLVYAYPGYLTHDAAAELVAVRAGDVTTAHALVWRVVDAVLAGPAGMLLVQSGLVLVGAYALLRRVLADRAAAVLAAGVLVFPPIGATVATISADALLPGLLVAGAALLARERRWPRAGGLALVALACGMRDAALFAALPIVVVAFARREAIAAAACVLCAVVTLASPTSSPSEVADAPYTDYTATAADGLDVHYRAHHAPAQRALVAVARALARTPLFAAYPYAIVAAVVLAFAIRRRAREAGALAASALAYELTRPPPTCWLALATVLALALLVTASGSPSPSEDARRRARPSP